MIIKKSQIKTFWLDEPVDEFLTNTALAMGNFDGIHIGHSKILEKLIEIAKVKNLIPILLTFDPHPRILFGENFYLLSTVYERELLLRKFDLPMIVHIRFDEKLANTSYRDFIEQYIVKSLGAKVVIVGYDHHFGKNREGNPQALSELGEKLGFETIVMKPVKHNETDVKSNFIRNLISQGQIERANEFLGHLYLVVGKVIAGRGLGRQIGYPTANLSLQSYKLIPPDGVYAAKSYPANWGKPYNSMVYIGRAPTFNLPQKMFETHIFDYDGKPLYGKHIGVELIKFIREDRYFRTVEALKAQIDNDAEQVRKLMGKE